MDRMVKILNYEFKSVHETKLSIISGLVCSVNPAKFSLLPRLIVDELLKYAQVIKIRAEGRLKKVFKRIIFGEDIDPKMISTSYIERLNLTCRQDNNRISRKTIGFSKKTEELDHQMTLYFANFNYCRKHRSLKYKDDQGKTNFNCPAKQAGLIDHIWSLHELLTYPYHIIKTY